MTSTYNGIYPEDQVKDRILWFITKDREINGERPLKTSDIIVGLKTYFCVEIDIDSIEYIMKKLGCQNIYTQLVEYELGADGRKYTNPESKKQSTQPFSLEEKYNLLSKKFAFGLSNYNPGTWDDYKKAMGF